MDYLHFFKFCYLSSSRKPPNLSFTCEIEIDHDWSTFHSTQLRDHRVSARPSNQHASWFCRIHRGATFPQFQPWYYQVFQNHSQFDNTGWQCSTRIQQDLLGFYIPLRLWITCVLHPSTFFEMGTGRCKQHHHWLHHKCLYGHWDWLDIFASSSQ